MTTRLARPPPKPATVPSQPTSVRIRHPGYGDYANNVLLKLPTVDLALPIAASPTDVRPARGLHHRTALSAGAIIADNAFDRAYLTYDQAGTRPVCDAVPLDGILEAGDYWLQLRGVEPPSVPEQEQDDGQIGRSDSSQRAPAAQSTVNITMPPPPRPAPAPTPNAELEYDPYPIVPSFRDWRFPHGRLPSEWLSSHALSTVSAQTSNPPLQTLSFLRCYLTGLRMGTNKCHLVPGHQSEWFSANGMADYVPDGRENIDHEANIISLRADLHLLFDQRRFVVVPKPLSSSPTTSYALAIHVLGYDEECCELSDLYQNVTLQPEYARIIGREFLFARFAWALFSFVRNFLDVPIRRHLAVITKSSAQAHQSLPRPQRQWMDATEYKAHLHQRGESMSGSRKRRSSQISQDESDGNTEDDAYQERWQRRRLGDAALLDPGERSLYGATDWYEKHCRFASRETPGERQLREATDWYEKHCRFASRETPNERRLREATEWYEERGRFASLDWADDDDDDGENRGRLRRRGYTPEGSVSDPGDVPNLSSSFTTGSNRSSSMEPPATELNKCWAGFDESSADGSTQKARLDSC